MNGVQKGASQEDGFVLSGFHITALGISWLMEGSDLVVKEEISASEALRTARGKMSAIDGLYADRGLGGSMCHAGPLPN